MNTPPQSKPASRRLVWGLTSLALAVSLGWLWLEQYGELLVLPEDSHLGWLVVGLACLALELPVRVWRTARLLQPPVRVRTLARPILGAHAIDLLGPPLAGDVSEVVFVGRAAGCGAGNALRTLLLRMVLTVAALCLMAAGATAHRQPVVALALLVIGLALARYGQPLLAPLSRWLSRSQPQGDTQSDESTGIASAEGRNLPGHLTLALLEVLLPGFALIALAAGLGTPLPVWLGLATVAALELLTYVPMPLGGIGLQHWGLVGMIAWLAPEAPAPALLAVAWHGAMLLVAGLGGVIALGLGSGRSNRG